jgi:RNA polymerase sigma factor (sigma-70 family)
LQEKGNIINLSNSTQITNDILEACLKDDRKAIKLLYEQCFKFLMPICFRYHPHQEDAQSSFNLGFMKILGNLESVLQSKANFVPWSKRVMINTLIDEYRKSKNYSSRVVGKETERELEYYDQGTYNDAENAMGYENIMDLVNELPIITAKVFNLYVIDGYAHKEIGELLEMSEGTSKWHLSVARKMLREKLEKLENNSQKMVI